MKELEDAHQAYQQCSCTFEQAYNEKLAAGKKVCQAIVKNIAVDILMKIKSLDSRIVAVEIDENPPFGGWGWQVQFVIECTRDVSFKEIRAIQEQMNVYVLETWVDYFMYIGFSTRYITDEPTPTLDI